MTTPHEPPQDESAAAASGDAPQKDSAPASETGTGAGAAAAGAEPASGTAPEAESDVAAASEADVAPEGEPEAAAESAAGTEAAPEPGTGPAADPATDPATEPATGAVTDAATEPEQEPEPEQQPEPTAEPVHAPAPEPEPAGAVPGARPAAEAGPGPGAEAEPAPQAVKIPRQRSRFRWLRIVAACTAFTVLVLGGATWYFYQRLDGNITTDTTTETQLRAQAANRPSQGPTSAENILLIGSDNRGDGNEKYGQDSGTQRSDTTILLHLAADRSGATAMSIPRDLMTHVPACTKPDGGSVPARFEQFNWAFEMGGAACTIRAVEDMTGIRIDHHLIVDFTGFKKMVDAVDGVEVCLPEAVHDENAHLDLPAGRQKLGGEKALGYVRARHGLGDGSDTQRMERQQDFLASLVKKVRGNGVLLNPVKLYPLLSAATSSLTADPGLDSLSELYELAHSIQQTPDGAIHFLTLPREQYSEDHNRDQLQQPAADRLFAAIRDDRAVNVVGDDSGASPTLSPGTDSPTGSSTRSPASTTGSSTGSVSTTGPTFRGTTADRDVCGKDQ